MKGSDKRTLAVIYAAGIAGSDIIGVMSKTFLPTEIGRRLDALAQKGLLAGLSLTKVGRDSIKVVLAGGVFDIIHPGHMHTINAAKALGDVLVVVVATDDMARRMKIKAPRHSEDERRGLVGMLEPVDASIIGQKDIFHTVRDVKPDIIALGYDQYHHEGQIKAGCDKLGLDVQVVRLSSPVPGMSSSKMESDVLRGL